MMHELQVARISYIQYVYTHGNSRVMLKFKQQQNTTRV